MHPALRALPIRDATPEDLRLQYRSGRHLFASAEQTLLACDSGHTFLPSSRQRLAHEAVAFLRERVRAGSTGLLIGTIPADPVEPPRLFAPTSLRHATGAFPPQEAPLLHNVSSPTPSSYSQPGPQSFRDKVREALARIQAGEFEAASLARRLCLHARVQPAQMLRRLGMHSPHACTYAIALEHSPEGETRTLLGSSPTVMLARRGRQLLANPAAGSIARSNDPIEDARRASHLLLSARARHEHALLVDTFVTTLRPYCRRLEVPCTPVLARSESVWMLSTPLRGELFGPAPSALMLALELQAATQPTHLLTFGQQACGFAHGAFGGLVGWCNMQGDGEWTQANPCALIDAHRTMLYADAGIATGADPENEWALTDAKLRPLLHSMGIGRR